MNWEDLAAKFRECAAASATPVTQPKVARAIELARSLENLSDGTDLIRALA